jgi:hypothetical protein
MSFGLDARKQQAEFRKSSATISQQGRMPTDDKGKNHGHLLALGHEEENLIPAIRGEQGARKFFFDRGIPWWRGGDAKRENGPTRNMASSQIACLNFLLPLASEPAALACILRSLDQDVVSVVEMEHQGRRSYVEFEWVGIDSTLEEGPYTRGANATSADALLVAETAFGRRAYLLEWKYVEQYTQDDSKAEGESGQTRLCRYHRLYEAVASPFCQDVPIEEWFCEPFYQILRLLLLGDKMVRNGEFEAKQAKVVVVCPRENRAYRNGITSPFFRSRYPHLTTVEEVVHAGLKKPEIFASTSCSELIVVLRRDFGSQLADWLSYHKARYGW